MPEQDFNAVFSKRLRYYLSQNNMTQVELAKKLNVGTTSVYNWCNGIKTPRMDKVDAMCDLFKCSRSDLIEEKTPLLTEKDEKDIEKTLQDTLNQLESEQNGLMFSGQALDDETRELLKISLENSLRMAKITAKKKFTPKNTGQMKNSPFVIGSEGCDNHELRSNKKYCPSALSKTQYQRSFYPCRRIGYFNCNRTARSAKWILHKEISNQNHSYK
ncbi:MAG: helix-turn-helix domain-containing protein [Gallintestinimicrobium sp.]